ncbi:hypothetical protein QBC37DRAFT_445994 [Rhypophila decipiens]|uniref:Uncharacterized protein n=1 Tax=Rhypophila decipiens TaxID=261697 RepID=A0AAN7B5E7_9PEZI|nr:hypothetical protein QBC37DRAFT_445994 [Rhypophila decipiens]
MSRLQLLILSVESQATRPSGSPGNQRRFKETERTQNPLPRRPEQSLLTPYTHADGSSRQLHQAPPQSSTARSKDMSDFTRQGPERRSGDHASRQRIGEKITMSPVFKTERLLYLSGEIQLDSDRQKCATKSTSPTSAATGAADLTQHHSPSSAADDKSPAWTEKRRAFFSSARSGLICQWCVVGFVHHGTGALVGLKVLLNGALGRDRYNNSTHHLDHCQNSTANATTGFSESRELSDKVIEFAVDLAVAHFGLVKKLSPWTSATSSRHRGLRHASSSGLPTKSQIINMLALALGALLQAHCCGSFR